MAQTKLITPVKRYTLHISLLLILVVMLAACTTSKNTPVTRFYHSFTARYNTYFNGHEAYKQGVLAQQQGNKDNFTEMLPVFAVSNKGTADMGKSSFNTAIEKCEKAIKNHSIKRKPKINRTRKRTPKQKKILAKKEYNPFLKNAWMLMGISQFHKGEFIEAASTFSYINRLYAAEPDVLAESRAWLAACYSELNWFYDAEDIFRNKIGRDSVPHSARKTLDASYADFYVRQQKYDEALPYLVRMAKHTKGSQAKARIHFLLGQIYNLKGDKKQAYKSLSKVASLSPPYEVQLNARVLQAEVVSKGKSKAMLSRLNRMAKKAKNIKYSDQIYHAIGNIHLAANDTDKAVAAYEQGVSKSTRSGVEKGALLLKLAGIYYSRNEFTACRRCLSKGAGMISKERKDYDSIQALNKVITKLEPHTAAVFVQDSMQALAKMPTDKQNAVFDKAIELEKKRIREERRKAILSGNKGNTGTKNAAGNANKNNNQASAASTNTGDDKKAWYFYNPTAVENGKQAFARQWGERELADNWRRSNKELSAQNDNGETTGEEGDESTQPKDTTTQTPKAAADTASAKKDDKKEKTSDKDKDNEKLTREYYLEQLPKTEEDIEASNKKIMENLHAAGVIEKDELANYALAEKSLTRVYTQYPTYEKMNEVLYQLFLLESQMGNHQLAQQYKNELAQKYSEDKLAKLITDPNYEYDSKYGKHLEDSLYTATYNAFREGNAAVVLKNAALSKNRFPDGDNRPKFMFLDALSNLAEGHREVFRNELDTLVKAYPKDDITPLAQSMLKGIKEGRIPGSGMYDIGSLWTRRSKGDAAVLDSIELARQLSSERNTDFNVIIAYPTDSVDENQLLYDVARYNFTNFAVRNFELEQTTAEGLGEMIVKGFTNFDEAHSYAQLLYNTPSVRRHFAHAKLIIISKANLEKLGTDFSIADYLNFYDKTFAPLKIKPELQLDKQTDIYQSEDDLPSNAQENAESEDSDDDSNSYPDDNNTDNNDDEWYDVE